MWRGREPGASNVSMRNIAFAYIDTHALTSWIEWNPLHRGPVRWRSSFRHPSRRADSHPNMRQIEGVRDCERERRQ